MADISSLNIMSFNCRGFNTGKSSYIQSLLNNNNVTILLLQEHWLASGQLHMLDNIDSDYSSVGISGFGNDEILSGRPYGGCAILWRSSIAATVDTLLVDSNRICSIRVTSDKYKILIINVYMPYEHDEASASVFLDQLSIIEGLIVDNPDCHIVAGGDFNVSFSRECLHTAVFRQFL